MPEDRIVIGRVGAVNVVKRELRIKPEPAYTYQFNQLKWIRLTPPGGEELRCKVTDVRETQDVYIVQLGPGTPKDLVGEMKNASATVAPEELSARSDEPPVLEELIGMTVVTTGGETLGEIADVLSAGGNDVAEVETAAGGRFMFPIVPEAVDEVDVEAGRVIVGDLTPFRVDHAD